MNIQSPNMWRISVEERQKHDQQFMSIGPIGGFVTGEQARNLFSKSGLPSQLLAQIWQLSDFNKDGKLDAKEFSIAMFLIQKRMQNFQLPPVLPDSLKLDPMPAAGGMPQMGGYIQPGPMGGHMGPRPMGMVPGNMSMPGYQPGVGTSGYMPQSLGAQPPMGYGTMPAGGLAALAGGSSLPGSHSASPSRRGSVNRSAATTPGPGNADLIMPQNSKLKYTQLFNQLDKGKIGYMSGVHARNILTQTQLPNNILAQVWTLSDVDKDGKLTPDEFCLAMHLADLAKYGVALPLVLPQELIPSSRVRTISMGSISGGAQQGSLMDGLPDSGASMVGGEELPQKPNPASFEDRRKLNFSKGQAELDRRRQALLDMERREREERDRKEAVEREKRDRERQEMERRRQLEIDKQMAKQREMQLKLEEEHMKMMEQREAARRDLERQRQAELEKQKLLELSHIRQREQETVCHLKQKQKNLTFQLQALTEKSSEMDSNITTVRDQILLITKTIEGMKMNRDDKVGAIQNLTQQSSQAQQALMQINGEKQQLSAQMTGLGDQEKVSESYRSVMHTFHTKEMNLESLKQALSELEKQEGKQQSYQEGKMREIDNSANELNQAQTGIDSLIAQILQRQEEVLARIDTAPAVANASVAGSRRESVKSGGSASQKAAVGQPSWPADDIAADAWPAPSDTFGADSDAFGADTFGNDAFSAPVAQTAATFDDSAWGQAADQFGASDAFGDDANWAAFGANGEAPVATAAAATPGADSTGSSTEPVTEKYRALYEYSASGDDELSFQPGDLITIFKNHKTHPGWLAAEFHEKVGWVPADFVTPVDESSPAAPGGIPASSSNEKPWTPNLDGIRESEEDKAPPVPPPPAGGDVVLRQKSVTANDAEFEGELIAQALYPWKAKKEDHLTLKKNDHIKVMQQEEMWWLGECEGRKGWFPKSCVKLIGGPRKRSSRPSSRTEPELLDAMHGAGLAPPSEVTPTQEQPSGDPTPTQESIANGTGMEYAVALYPFEKTEDGDLPFSVGDRVVVLSKEGEWWKGSFNGNEGIFPANYVEIVGTTNTQNTHAPAQQVSRTNSVQTGSRHGSTGSQQQQPLPVIAQAVVQQTVTIAPPVAAVAFEVAQAIATFSAQTGNQLTLAPGDLIKVRAKSPTGWWEGELNQKGQDKRIGWFPGNYVKLLEKKQSVSSLKSAGSGSLKSAAGSVRSANGGFTGFLAVYDYVAQQDDELSFSAGDKVTVTEKVDADWWKGQVGSSAIGLFPSSYVQQEIPEG